MREYPFKVCCAHITTSSLSNMLGVATAHPLDTIKVRGT